MEMLICYTITLTRYIDNITYAVYHCKYVIYTFHAQVFELGLSNRWDGFMLGIIELSISVPLYNQASTLLLTGESTPVIFSVGGT